MRAAVHVRHRSDRGKWGVHWRESKDGKRVKAARFFESEKEANDFAAEKRRELADGHTLTGWSEQWLKDHEPRRGDPDPDLRRSTFRGYSIAIRTHLQPRWGHLPLKDFTPQEVCAFYRYMQDEAKLSAKTAATYALPVKQMLDLAMAKNLIPSNPMKDGRTMFNAAYRVRGRSRRPKERAPFDVETAKKLLTVGRLRFPRDFDMIAVQMLSGIRIGEVVVLQPEDDKGDHLCIMRGLSDEGEIYNTKSGRGRVAPMNPALRAVLDRQHARWEADCKKFGKPPAPWLFYTYELERPGVASDRPSGNYIGKRNLIRNFNLVMKELGIEGPDWLTNHSLRHMFITELLSEGVEAHVVKSIAGHSDLSTTLKYAERRRTPAGTTDQFAGNFAGLVN